MQEWSKWCVDRRYSACLTLHMSLKEAGFDVPSFPPKVFFGKTATAKVVARQSAIPSHSALKCGREPANVAALSPSPVADVAVASPVPMQTGHG